MGTVSCVLVTNVCNGVTNIVKIIRTSRRIAFQCAFVTKNLFVSVLCVRSKFHKISKILFTAILFKNCFMHHFLSVKARLHRYSMLVRNACNRQTKVRTVH